MFVHPRSRLCFFFVASAVLGAAAPGAAHVGALESRSPYLVDGEIIGAGTTWGITLEEAGEFVRTCDEATDGITQWTAHTSAAVLVGTTDGLFRTQVGCALEPIASVEGVPFLVAQADDPDVLAVVTAAADATRVYRSIDGGETLALLHERPQWNSLSLAISRDGEWIVVAGYNAEVTPEVLAVDEEGAEVLPLVFDAEAPPAFINVVGTDDQGSAERFALALISPAQTSDLALLDVESLLSGAPQEGALSAIGSFDEVVTHYASTASGRAVLLNRRTFLSQLGESSFKLEPTGPTRCLQRHPTAALMVGCGTDESGDGVATSVDGRTWNWSLPFVSVVDRLCPPGTIGRFRCAYLFPDIDAGPEPIFDAGAPGDDGGTLPDAGDADGGGSPDDGGASKEDGGVQDGGPSPDAGKQDSGVAQTDGGQEPPPGACSCDGTKSDGTKTGGAAFVVLALAIVTRRRNCRRG